MYSCSAAWFFSEIRVLFVFQVVLVMLAVNWQDKNALAAHSQSQNALELLMLLGMSLVSILFFMALILGLMWLYGLVRNLFWRCFQIEEAI